MPDLTAQEPWPGLDSFHESQSGFFFGRGEMVRRLVQLVERNVLGVLFGLSGLGKTSLLRAGLFPELRQRRWLPVYLRLDYGANASPPLAQLREALLASAADAGVEAPALRDKDSMWELLHRQGSAFWNARSELVTPVFVLDQFEEMFTLGESGHWSAGERTEFLDFLSDLAAGCPPQALRKRFEDEPDLQEQFTLARSPARILLSLREDFLAELEGLRVDFRTITRHRLRLVPLDGSAALEAVVQPGEGVVDGGVAEHIVRFVAAAKSNGAGAALSSLKVEPALLSVVCRELNLRRMELGQPKITAELLSGNQTAILEDFYERAVAGQSAEVRQFIEEELLTRSGHRDSRAVEDALARPGFSPEALRQLVEHRLLRVEERGGVPRLELTHDRLTGVILTSRDRRRERERDAESTAREKELRARLGRSRAISMGFAALGLVALAAAALAFWNAQKAREEAERANRNRELAVTSQVDAQAGAAKTSLTAAQALWQVGEMEMTNRRVPLGLAVLASAIRLDARLAPQALPKLQGMKWLLPDSRPIELGEASTHVQFSDDGKLLAVCGPSGLRVFGVAEGSLRCGPLEHKGGATSLSPDGGRVLAISKSGTLRVIDSTTGQMLAEFTLPQGAVSGAQFADGGKKIVVTLEGGERAWIDAVNGQPAEAGEVPPIIEAGDAAAPLGEHIFYKGPATARAISAQGKVATGDGNGQVLIWHPVELPASLQDQAKVALVLEGLGGLRLSGSGIPEATPWESRLEAARLLLPDP